MQPIINNRRDRRRQLARSQLIPNPDMAKVISLLKDIKGSTASDQESVLPRVPDVPRISLKRDRLFTYEVALQSSIISPAASPLDTFGAYAFRLSDFTNATEFTALYDMYRFLQLEFTFVPTAEGNYGGTLLTVIDYTDNTAPTGINQLLQYNTLQTTQPGALTTRTVTPRISNALYSGAFTSYGVPALQWIQCDSPNVFHYGLKWAISGLSGQAGTPAYQVWIRAVIQCKSVR